MIQCTFMRCSMTLGLLILVVIPVSAAEYFTNAGVSFKRLDFSVQDPASKADYALSPVFTMLSVSGGMVVEDYYLAVTLEQSLFDAELDSAVLSGDKDSLSRSDSNITLGYYIKNNISVFAGYLSGDTEDEYSSPQDNNTTGTFSFSEEGPFVGANTVIPISTGALSVNFAYAFLDGEYETHYKNAAGQGEQTIKGDTTGISVGAKYVGQWKPRINYFLGAKLNLFEFKSESFTTEENFYIAQAGFSYNL